VCVYVRDGSDVYVYVSGCSDICVYVRDGSDVYVYVSGCSDICVYVRVCSDVCVYVRVYVCVCRVYVNTQVSTHRRMHILVRVSLFRAPSCTSIIPPYSLCVYGIVCGIESCHIVMSHTNVTYRETCM